VSDPSLTPEQRRRILARMQVPLLSFVALLALLGINVLFGATNPFPQVWMLETLVLASMVAVMLLFSMEILHESPLIRLFSVLGFCWVAILFGLTMIDYLTR
jgi:cytochrome c oxidase subunit 4